MSGNYYREPDCCGCFPLECGVRTLFFLTFLGAVLTIINIIVGAVEEQWYVFIEILILIPVAYTLFWVLAWFQTDNFGVRYRISQGFLYMVIVGVTVQVIVLIVIIAAFDEWWANTNADEEFDKYYRERYDNITRPYTNQPLSTVGTYSQNYGTYSPGSYIPNN